MNIHQFLTRTLRDMIFKKLDNTVVPVPARIIQGSTSPTILWVELYSLINKILYDGFMTLGCRKMKRRSEVVVALLEICSTSNKLLDAS